MSTRAQDEHSGRRAALKLLLGGGIGASLGCATMPRAQAGAGPALSCLVRPAQTEGPYFIDQQSLRSDIRVDPTDGAISHGTPLELTFGVQALADGSCAPLARALVDVWQCDASGTYSGVVDLAGRFDTSGKKFLRGSLFTNEEGLARFITIFPGHYPGRAPHIHFKIRDRSSSGGAMYDFTSQLYFDEALTKQVYAQAPYRQRIGEAATNGSDWVYRAGGERLVLDVASNGAGYHAAFGIGLHSALLEAFL